jgi:hypothetical protein
MDYGIYSLKVSKICVILAHLKIIPTYKNFVLRNMVKKILEVLNEKEL